MSGQPPADRASWDSGSLPPGPCSARSFPAVAPPSSSSDPAPFGALAGSLSDTSHAVVLPSFRLSALCHGPGVDSPVPVARIPLRGLLRKFAYFLPFGAIAWPHFLQTRTLVSPSNL